MLTRNRTYQTNGLPSMGGRPPVSPEPVRIIRPEPLLGADWYIVRFMDKTGGYCAMHASNIRPL